MNVTPKMLDELAAVRSTNLEADLVRLIAERTGLAVDEAFRVYYESDFSEQVARNEFGEQFLDASYLADEFLSHAVSVNK